MIEAYAIANYLFTRLEDRLTQVQSSMMRKKFDRESWAGEIEKLNRIDGFGWLDILQVIDWWMNDKFWIQNCRSAMGLRRKGKNGYTKFEMMVSKMSTNPKYKFTSITECQKQYLDVTGRSKEYYYPGCRSKSTKTLMHSFFKGLKKVNG